MGSGTTLQSFIEVLCTQSTAKKRYMLSQTDSFDQLHPPFLRKSNCRRTIGLVLRSMTHSTRLCIYPASMHLSAHTWTSRSHLFRSKVSIIHCRKSIGPATGNSMPFSQLNHWLQPWTHFLDNCPNLAWIISPSSPFKIDKQITVL